MDINFGLNELYFAGNALSSSEYTNVAAVSNKQNNSFDFLGMLYGTYMVVLFPW